MLLQMTKYKKSEEMVAQIQVTRSIPIEFSGKMTGNKTTKSLILSGKALTAMYFNTKAKKGVSL